MKRLTLIAAMAALMVGAPISAYAALTTAETTAQTSAAKAKKTTSKKKKSKKKTTTKTTTAEQDYATAQKNYIGQSSPERVKTALSHYQTAADKGSLMAKYKLAAINLFSQNTVSKSDAKKYTEMLAEIADSVPQARYTLAMYRWRAGKMKPQEILEATLQDYKEESALDAIPLMARINIVDLLRDCALQSNIDNLYNPLKDTYEMLVRLKDDESSSVYSAWLDLNPTFTDLTITSDIE